MSSLAEQLQEVQETDTMPVFDFSHLSMEQLETSKIKKCELTGIKMPTSSAMGPERSNVPAGGGGSSSVSVERGDPEVLPEVGPIMPNHRRIIWRAAC